MRVLMARSIRCSAVVSTIREIEISRSRLACRMISGASFEVVIETWLMSGKMFGTRPQSALYGVVALMLISALPAKTVSAKSRGNGM